MSRVRRTAPERTCIGCRASAPQDELLRIGRLPDGSVGVGRSSGRGAYVHRDRTCVERSLRVAVLARALRRGLSTDELGRLRERIEGELGSV